MIANDELSREGEKQIEAVIQNQPDLIQSFCLYNLALQTLLYIFIFSLNMIANDELSREGEKQIEAVLTT